MLSINTNLSSLIAQSSMKTSTNKLNQAIERMSTGYKINHAKDNAANYSISTNMTTRMSAYQVAEDNVAMGMDLMSVAESSLTQIQDKLERLRALQVQASNGTYSEQSLKAINTEANALVDEVERLYSTSVYEGKSILGNNSDFDQEVTIIDTSDATPLAEVDKNITLPLGKYTISSQEDLEKLSEMQNKNKLTTGSTFILVEDIFYKAKTESGFDPVGKTYSFNCNFYGNGHTIYGLKINNTATSCALFRNIGSAGKVQDLGLEDVDITAYEAGGVAVSVTGILQNCYVSGGSITGIHAAGGFACVANGADITNCHSDVEATSNRVTGGLFALIKGGANIDNCYSTGNVTTDVTNAQYSDWNTGVGGFVYEISETSNLKNCYCTGNVLSDGQYNGGFLGKSQSNNYIENCYTTSDITTYKDTVVGRSSGSLTVGFGSVVGTIKNCYSTGKVSAEGSRSLFAGELGSTVIFENCYALGEFTEDTDSIIDKAGILLSYANSSAEAIVNGFYYNDKYKDSALRMVRKQDGGVVQQNNLEVINSAYRPYSLKKDKSTNIHVGIYGDESSIINVDTQMKLKGLDYLRNIGSDNEDYLSKLDLMLRTVQEKSTQFGATSNRLESVLEEIFIQYDNLASSRSTIRDADMAELSSTYIQQQILQQAAATLMSTANQSPAIALQLI